MPSGPIVFEQRQRIGGACRIDVADVHPIAAVDDERGRDASSALRDGFLLPSSVEPSMLQLALRTVEVADVRSSQIVKSQAVPRPNPVRTGIDDGFTNAILPISQGAWMRCPRIGDETYTQNLAWVEKKGLPARVRPGQDGGKPVSGRELNFA